MARHLPDGGSQYVPWCPRGHRRDAPERDFFTPQVDTPAADALAIMLSHGVRALTPVQRTAWARFLVSFAVRTPETLRDMGPAEFRKAMEVVRAQAAGPPKLEAVVTELIRRKMPSHQRNMPLVIAMDLASDPSKRETVEMMDWWLRRLARNAILLGDRPLLASPRLRYPCGLPLDSPNCLIALPIAPETVFFASGNPKRRAKMRRTAHGRLARIVNEETIWRATECVYALDGTMNAFIKVRLEGKANGTWQPRAV
jgi:hypothetical protein